MSSLSCGKKAEETAFKRKKEKYSKLSAACMEAGWKAAIYLVEAGCIGFAGNSIKRFLKAHRITGFRQKSTFKELAEEAGPGRFHLWLRRKDTQ